MSGRCVSDIQNFNIIGYKMTSLRRNNKYTVDVLIQPVEHNRSVHSIMVGNDITIRKVSVTGNLIYIVLNTRYNFHRTFVRAFTLVVMMQCESRERSIQICRIFRYRICKRARTAIRSENGIIIRTFEQTSVSIGERTIRIVNITLFQETSNVGCRVIQNSDCECTICFGRRTVGVRSHGELEVLVDRSTVNSRTYGHHASTTSSIRNRQSESMCRIFKSDSDSLGCSTIRPQISRSTLNILDSRGKGNVNKRFATNLVSGNVSDMNKVIRHLHMNLVNSTLTTRSSDGDGHNCIMINIEVSSVLNKCHLAQREAVVRNGVHIEDIIISKEVRHMDHTISSTRSKRQSSIGNSRNNRSILVITIDMECSSRRAVLHIGSRDN